MLVRTVFALMAVGMLLVTTGASAQDRDRRESLAGARRSPNPEVREAAARVDDEGHYPVRWDEHWTPVHWAEYPFVFLAVTYAAWGNLFLTSSSDASFRGGILLDEPVRSFARLSREEDRITADAISDILWPLTQYYPLVDSLFVAPIIHREPELAWRMFWIQAEAKGLAAVITWTTSRSVGRERPIGSDCDNDPEYSPDCDSDNRYRSFYSGHVAMTVVGAGLTCAQHENMNLYGGGWADRLPCLLSIASASTVGVLRIMSDKHYLSDVIVGAAIGFGAGYLWPSLVRYSGEAGPADPQYDHPGDDERPARRRPAVRAALVPWGTPDSVGLGLVGVTD